MNGRVYFKGRVKIPYDQFMRKTLGMKSAVVIEMKDKTILNRFSVFWGSRVSRRIYIELIATLSFIFGIMVLLVFPIKAEEVQINQSFNQRIHNVIPNLRKINDKIFAGGRPRELGIKQLAAIGIKTIVDLRREVSEREPGEVRKEKKWAEKLGMQFFAVPMHPFFTPKGEEIDEAVALIVNPANQPVFIHCDRGKDRTGMVIAAYRVKIDKWPPEKAYEEMKKNGFSWLLFCWKRFFFKYMKACN